MTARRDLLRRDPARFGFLALMREFERSHPDRPRIGRNATLAEETVTPGQDPLMTFPDANVTGLNEGPGRAPRLRTRFLGYFGPQGALPLNTTQEVYQWFVRRDDAFVRLADVFTARFLQLFFRAWSDARGITQLDHPADDRFQTYVGAFAGIASPAFRDRDSVPDMARLPLAGLVAGRVKSPVRLRQLLEALLGVAVQIEEHMPMWLEFEPDDCTRLGASGSRLGQDCRLGARVQSANDKVRISIRCGSLAEYNSFLPGAANFQRLSDLVFWYLGPATEVEVAPMLPANQIAPARLGGAGGGAALGWTGWVAPETDDGQEPSAYVGNAVFAARRSSGTDRPTTGT